MPIYNNTFPPYSVAPGEEGVLLNNETIGAGNFSQRVAIADPYGLPPRPVVMAFSYAAAPATVQYDIYVAQDDGTPILNYTKVGSTTNVNGDQVTLQRGAAGGAQFLFICVREVITPNQLATVEVLL